MTTMFLDQHTIAPTRASQARRRPAPRSTVRLTRRGRVVVFVATLLALLAVGLIGAGLSGAATHGGRLQTHAVLVQPGDTLWDIASQAAHGGDVRGMEQEIKDINGLSSSDVFVGQTIRVPR
jgi:Tfp pilus assembly protein FimV